MSQINYSRNVVHAGKHAATVLRTYDNENEKNRTSRRRRKCSSVVFDLRPRRGTHVSVAQPDYRWNPFFVDATFALGRPNIKRICRASPSHETRARLRAVRSETTTSGRQQRRTRAREWERENKYRPRNVHTRRQVNVLGGTPTVSIGGDDVRGRWADPRAVKASAAYTCYFISSTLEICPEYAI